MIRKMTGYQRSLLAIAVLLMALACRSHAAQGSLQDSTERSFENEWASISVKVHSGVYTYKITNRTNHRIIDFKVITPAAFAIIVPRGWEKEIAKEYLRAATGTAGSPIAPEQTGSFQLYAIGKGSVMGTASVHLGFESGQACTIDSIWAPVLEPRYYTWLVVIGLLSILTVHTALLARRGNHCEKAHQ